jgi:hypothetical protein
MSSNAKKTEKAGGKTGPFRDVQRGTQDELEIIGLIVATSPNIRQAVYEQIRRAKKRMQERDKKSTPVAE